MAMVDEVGNEIDHHCDPGEGAGGKSRADKPEAWLTQGPSCGHAPLAGLGRRSRRTLERLLTIGEEPQILGAATQHQPMDGDRHQGEDGSQAYEGAPPAQLADQPGT